MNFIKIIVSTLKKNYLILLVLAISLIPVFWTGFDEVLGGGDDNAFLNPASYFRFSVWNEMSYANNLSTDLPQIFPFGFFWWGLGELGLGNPIIEKLWLFIMYATAGFSIIYLCKTLFPKKYRIISLFAVPFYFFNIFVVSIPLTIGLRYTMSFTPLFLAIFVRGLGSKTYKGSFYYAMLFGLASLFSASGFMNPPAASIMMLVPFFYFLFSIVMGSLSDLPKKTFFGLFSLLFFLAVNAFWLWGFVYLLFAKNFGSDYVWGYFATTSLYDLFRTGGCWWYAKDPYSVHQQAFYQSFGLVFLSYFPIVVAYSAFLHVKKNKNILFLLFLSVLGLFLAKGTLDPAGGLFGELFEKVSFFKGFREPWAKFTPILVLSLSVLFGYGCSEILYLLNRLRNKVFISSFLLLVISSLIGVGYPSILGVNFWDLNFVGQRSARVKMPDYWYDMVRFFDSTDSNDAVYVTPRNLSARDYNWETGTSSLVPLEYLYLKNPIRISNLILQGPYENFDGFFKYFGSYSSMNTPNFINFLNMLGVKYIVQENDVLWGPKRGGNYSPRMMEAFFDKASYLDKIHSFGKIDIYELSDSYYQPSMYLSTKLVLADGPEYGFDNWNRKENAFSIVQLSDIDFDLDNFSTANLITRDGEDISDFEKVFEFSIKFSGQYFININFTDNRKVDFLDVQYKIDSGPWKNAHIDIDRAPTLEKTMSIVGYRDAFVNSVIGEETLSSEKHTLIVRSDSIKPDFIDGLNYISLNRYFSEEPLAVLPDIKVDKKGDTLYYVTLPQLTRPVIFNFAQNFDDNWKLYLLKDGKKEQLLAQHLKVNGINNGWYIDPKDLPKGDVTLVIEYALQKPFMSLLFISLISAVSCLVGLIIFKSKHYVT